MVYTALSLAAQMFQHGKQKHLVLLCISAVLEGETNSGLMHRDTQG